MKRSYLKLSLAACMISAMTIACNNSTTNTSDNDDGEELTSGSTDINVSPLDHSKEFPGAELQIASLTSEKVGTDSAKITVRYTVSNFELTDQTEDDHADHLANSHDGQHIHFILNNEPYDALYEPEHSVTVPVNSEHYLLSFLSRSYHESIKTADAHKLVKFKINENGEVEELPTPTEPSLFYSRPKGEYKGADTDNLLLDYYIVNTEVSPSSNKVKAVVNGEEFILDQWQPYEITGAPLGELKVQLTLIDGEGNAITGDNVSIERNVTLLAE